MLSDIVDEEGYEKNDTPKIDGVGQRLFVKDA